MDLSKENADLNQYWYSQPTIDALCSAAVELSARTTIIMDQHSTRSPPSSRIAFLSTPSLYFALPAAARAGHAVLDLDTQWASDPGFIRYDFNDGAGGLPASALGSFGVVVIDPPFITEPVWRQYAAAAHALLAPGGHVLCTTVAENQGLLASLFPGCARVPFQPSIPHLVYQYDCFCSAQPVPAALAVLNPEIPA